MSHSYNSILKDILMIQIAEVVSTKCMIDFGSDVESMDEIHMPIYNLMNVLLSEELLILRIVIRGSADEIDAFVKNVCVSDSELHMVLEEKTYLASDILKLKNSFGASDLDDLLVKMSMARTM